MKYVLIGFAVILLLLVIVGISGCGSYNSIVGSSQAVDSSWGDVQSQYQRRDDLIKNLVSTVQGAANFEKSTLDDVVRARASASQVNVSASTAPTDPNQLKQYEAAQGAVSQSLNRLLVTVERYPELKATQNFLTLQAQLEGTENRISVARDGFNTAVQDYNTRVQRFPGVIVARMGGYMPRPYFAGTTEAQSAPSVNFNFDGKTSAAPPATPAVVPGEPAATTK